MWKRTLRKVFFLLAGLSAIGALCCLLVAAGFPESRLQLPFMVGAFAAISWSLVILAFWLSGEPISGAGPGHSCQKLGIAGTLPGNHHVAPISRSIRNC